MRKWNAVISVVLLILFGIHGILSAFNIAGIGGVNIWQAAIVLSALAMVHAVIGVILTIKTLLVWKKTKTPYFKQNKLFWVRRLSGLLVLLLLSFHTGAWGTSETGVFRLQWFDTMKLAFQLIWVLALAIHILSNVRPLMLALGAKGYRQRVADILFVMTVLLFIMAIGFIVYFVRWNVL